jgi:hypothetical protein
LIDEHRNIASFRRTVHRQVFIGWHERHIKAALLQGSPLNPSEKLAARRRHDESDARH